MKKKIIMIAMLLCALSTAAMAQITTGEPSAKKIRTGNRPEAGDFGLFIGTSVNAFVDAVEFGSLIPMPIINVKYYVTDHIETRASIDANLFNEKTLGKVPTEGKEIWIWRTHCQRPVPDRARCRIPLRQYEHFRCLRRC